MDFICLKSKLNNEAKTPIRQFVTAFSVTTHLKRPFNKVTKEQVKGVLQIELCSLQITSLQSRRSSSFTKQQGNIGRLKRPLKKTSSVNIITLVPIRLSLTSRLESLQWPKRRKKTPRAKDESRPCGNEPYIKLYTGVKRDILQGDITLALASSVATPSQPTPATAVQLCTLQ